MLFGSAWRKAIPLSVLFFSATFIFTMVSSHCVGSLFFLLRCSMQLLTEMEMRKIISLCV
jgi:hypothetical protein